MHTYLDPLLGIPVSPARALIDCTSVLSAASVARFAETWLSTAVVSFDDLDHEMAMWPNRPGLANLRRTLDGRELGRAEPDSRASVGNMERDRAQWGT